MATLQCLSFIAEKWQVGSVIREEDSAKRALGIGYQTLPSVNSRGFEMLFFARVTIRWTDSKGAEGGDETLGIIGTKEDSADVTDSDWGDYKGVDREGGAEGIEVVLGCGTKGANGYERRGRENGCLEFGDEVSLESVEVLGKVDSVKTTSQEIYRRFVGKWRHL
jgi:hypothetical protein